MTEVRCSFAGCKRPGRHYEPAGKWHFCSEHYGIHLALRREELGHPKPETRRGPRPTQPCGSHAAYERHRARGEYPCPPCREAERKFQAARYARRKTA